MVCTGCCATLDHIVTYLFKKVTNKGEMRRKQYFDVDKVLNVLVVGKKSRNSNQTSPDNDSLVTVVKMRPEILQQMLQTVGLVITIVGSRLKCIVAAGVKHHHVRRLSQSVVHVKTTSWSNSPK